MKNGIKKGLNLLVLLLVLQNCGDDKLKKIYRLESFRILGIKADTPEVSVNSLPVVVALTPIMSDVKGGGRLVRLEVSGCSDPGVSIGADPTCVGAIDREDYDYPDFNPVALRSDIYSGPMASINITIPANFLNGRNLFDQYNGFSYLVTFTFTVGGEIFKAYKRILVSAKRPTALNTNPIASAIFFNNTHLTSVPTKQGSLDMATASLPEDYLLLNLDGKYEPYSEELGLSWFVSSGEVSTSSTSFSEQNLYTPSNPAPESLVVIAVLRDGRGGLDYTIKKVP